MSEHVSFPKPKRGMALLARRQKTAERVKAEQKAMREAKQRDSQTCRRPRCQHKKLPVDACHMRHRGMGGNPKGDRTTRATVISLCRIDHGLYDAGDLWIEPLTAQDFDGPCEFYEKHQETGVMEHIGTETRIGVSVAVGS
jgi:hypothetical protein